MNLTIVTPEGKIYEGEKVKSITLPTTSGVITVLSSHEPLLSSLDAGVIEVEEEAQTKFFAVNKGVLDVRRESKIFILADSALRAEDIDLEAAEEARKRAEEILANKETAEDVSFAGIQAQLQKEIAKISAAQKYRG